MWQISEKRGIFSLWFLWHYLIALREIYLGWKDIFLFVLNYFSISFLLKTIFSPWRRYRFSFRGGFDIGKVAEVVVFNVFSRALGMAVRTAVILMGIITAILVIIFGVFIILMWVLLPVAVIFGLFFSLQCLIFN